MFTFKGSLLVKCWKFPKVGRFYLIKISPIHILIKNDSKGKKNFFYWITDIIFRKTGKSIKFFIRPRSKIIHLLPPPSKKANYVFYHPYNDFRTFKALIKLRGSFGVTLRIIHIFCEFYVFQVFHKI